MKVLHDLPGCPGCHEPVTLKFEATPHPRIQCTNIMCEGRNYLFPYPDGPPVTAEQVLTQWAEFRKGA